ncbi:hypothetical protein [Pedobacter yulinensis]|nr:hypothetical protein [Pedobacter yulinensis]
MNKLFILTLFISSSLLQGLIGRAQTQAVYQAGSATVSLEPGPADFSLALAGYGFPRGGRFSIDWKAASLPLSKFKSGKTGKRWKAVALANHFPTGTISVTAYKNRLLALTANDELYRLDAGNLKGEWIRFAAFNGSGYDVHLQSITIHSATLYGLSKDGKVYRAGHQSSADLSARALAISQGKSAIVMVGTDLCGFNHDFINSIKQEAYRRHGLNPEALLINASHTHFAPATQDWTTWGSHQLPDTNYLNGVVRPAILKAIALALKNRKPAWLSFGRGKTDIGHNRTLPGSDAPYDNDLDVLQVERTGDHSKSLVFLTGCHPVFKNEGAEGFTLSANYPGITRALLQQEAGIGDALFLQGCGGDINPVSTDHVKTGTDLAANVRSILRQPMQQISGGINFHVDSVQFPVKPWSREQIAAFRKENDNGRGDVTAEKNVRWSDLMTRLDQQGRMPRTMPVYMQTLNIGNWKLVGISRETVTSYSLAVKQLWPGKLVSVAGYCNDVSSYLPTSRHISAGVYEGNDSFFWYGQPSVFPLNVFETIIKQIKANNH